jgi:hypothetical protein
MSRTQKENIFAQSTFTKVVWEKSSSVMNMFEKGELKDQKLNKKHLTAAPELKQHHLQPLCRLPENIQTELLDLMIEKELSLKEMKDKADHFRQLEV